MSGRDQAAGWIGAVLRDYGPEAWDDEASVRRDAEFLLIDPESLARRASLLRKLGATGGNREQAVDELSQRGPDGASPEAIRAVLADPVALCQVHCNAWTSAGPWGEALERYRARRREATKLPETGPDVLPFPGRRSLPVLVPAAASESSDCHEIEHKIELAGRITDAEVQGRLYLWKAGGHYPPDSWWLTIRLPSPPSGSADIDATRPAVADYRDKVLFVECPGRRRILSLKVLLVSDDGGGLISDRYFLEDVDPTSKSFAFTVNLNPNG